MKRFLLTFITFTIVLIALGEVVIRVFKLTPDIPHLYVDNTGIQRYIPGQKGYFSKASQWEVNTYGWLGIAETQKAPIISIIGDSYIENLMNPIICNQGSILKSYFEDFGFFEAGRSGVTFIEALQITKLLDSTIKPSIHLIYVSEEDFYESNAKYRLKDRMQINLASNKIVNGELKAPGIKKVLYNIKAFYYLYLRFPVFVSGSNKESTHTPIKKEKVTDYQFIENLLKYSSLNYDAKKIVLVWHPGTPASTAALAQKYGFATIGLNTTGEEKNWTMSSVDAHWSCYGHHEVAKQIKAYLATHMKINERKMKIALNKE